MKNFLFFIFLSFFYILKAEEIIIKSNILNKPNFNSFFTIRKNNNQNEKKIVQAILGIIAGGFIAMNEKTPEEAKQLGVLITIQSTKDLIEAVVSEVSENKKDNPSAETKKYIEKRSDEIYEILNDLLSNKKFKAYFLEACKQNLL